MNRRLAVLAAVPAIALGLGACTDDPEPTVTTTITHPVKTTPSKRPDRSPITPGSTLTPRTPSSVPQTEPPYSPFPTTLSAPEQAFLLRLEGIRPDLTNDDNDALTRATGLCPVVEADRPDEVLRSAVLLAWGRHGLRVEDADAIGVAVRELCNSIGPDAA